MLCISTGNSQPGMPSLCSEIQTCIFIETSKGYFNLKQCQGGGAHKQKHTQISLKNKKKRFFNNTSLFSYIFGLIKYFGIIFIC